MTIRPGTVVTYIGHDGIKRTERIETIGWKSSEPAIYKRLTGWEKLCRRLTPKRWRKPIPIVRPYQPDRMVLGFKDDPDAVALGLKQVERINEFAKLLQVHEPTINVTHNLGPEVQR